MPQTPAQKLVSRLRSSTDLFKDGKYEVHRNEFKLILGGKYQGDGLELKVRLIEPNPPKVLDLTDQNLLDWLDEFAGRAQLGDVETYDTVEFRFSEGCPPDYPGGR